MTTALAKNRVLELDRESHREKRMQVECQQSNKRLALIRPRRFAPPEPASAAVARLWAAKVLT
jgi:hypothetical protein